MSQSLAFWPYWTGKADAEFSVAQCWVTSREGYLSIRKAASWLTEKSHKLHLVWVWGICSCLSLIFPGCAESCDAGIITKDTLQLIAKWPSNRCCTRIPGTWNVSVCGLDGTLLKSLRGNGVHGVLLRPLSIFQWSP